MRRCRVRSIYRTARLEYRRVEASQCILNVCSVGRRVVMPLRGKQDLKLIRAVRDNPELFDRKDPKYSDLNHREVLWQKISDELKCTGKIKTF